MIKASSNKEAVPQVPKFSEAPIPMLIWCPECGTRHVDRGIYATKSHHTHACQECGCVWRPAVVATVGVQFLPGFKDTNEGNLCKLFYWKEII